MIRRYIFLLAAAFAAALAATSAATSVNAAEWDDIQSKARGQSVYWNAWGGSETINDYIAWVGEQVQARYGVTLRHVKLSDTADAVSKVLAEKTAGKTSGGSIDLIWINGENFAAMKRGGLLFGPFTDKLSNYRLIDTEGKKSTTVDFTIPVDGLEAPWGMAQFIFIHDTATLATPPRSIPALLEWAKANPGRFTYPQPPNFIGSTFLKQALIELAADPGLLQKPADDADFDAVTAPLWVYLDALRPHLWRGGRAYPQNGPAQRQLLADGEVAISMAFNPASASSDIAKGLLPETARSFVLEGGTIGNTHFVAIPFNANAKEGAMVVADYLMSPEAQIRKQDPDHWGDFTVLDLARLEEPDRARFEGLDLGAATLSPAQLGRTLLEPHPSWMTRIEEEWQKRYAQ